MIGGIVSERSIHGCDKYYALIVHRKEASHDVLNINGYEGLLAGFGSIKRKSCSLKMPETPSMVSPKSSQLSDHGTVGVINA